MPCAFAGLSPCRGRGGGEVGEGTPAGILEGAGPGPQGKEDPFPPTPPPPSLPELWPWQSWAGNCVLLLSRGLGAGVEEKSPPPCWPSLAPCQYCSQGSWGGLPFSIPLLSFLIGAAYSCWLAFAAAGAGGEVGLGRRVVWNTPVCWPGWCADRLEASPHRTEPVGFSGTLIHGALCKAPWVRASPWQAA